MNDKTHSRNCNKQDPCDCVDKYFLAIGFKEPEYSNLEDFHVTLFYIGPITPEWKLDKLIAYLDERLKLRLELKRGYYMPTLTFNKREMFGANTDIPVLLLENPHDKLWLEENLSLKLSDMFFFTERKRFPFKPHITTGLEEVKVTPEKLYLCKNGYRIEKEWVL